MQINQAAKKKLVSLLMFLSFLCLFPQIVFAQPEPPINIRVYSYENRNRIIWTHNSQNPAGYVTNYQICRSTVSGAEVPVLTRPYTTSGDDTTVGYDYGTEFFYTVRAVGTDTLVSVDSEEVKRFIPHMGMTDIPQQIVTLNTRFFSSWQPYPGQWTDTYWRIRSQPYGGSNNLPVGLYNRTISSYERTGTISPGGPYYLEILIARPDWAGNPTSSYWWVSISDSLPFFIEENPPFEDNASSTYFNNSQYRTMTTPLPSGGVATKPFSGSGGGFWRMRQPIRVRPYTSYDWNSKLNAPCRVTIPVAANEMAAGRSATEVRVADEHGRELESVVVSETTAGAWVNSFTVHFIVPSQYYNEYKNYWIYWCNSSATAPSYNFSNHTAKTSQYEYTPWYSRRLVRAGLETYPDTDAARVIPNPPSPADEDIVNYTLPFTFPYYDLSTNTVSLSPNGYISFSPYAQPLNTWAEFTGNNPYKFIAPFWCNLMVNDVAPANSGLFFRHYNSSKYYERIWFTWVANRFNAETEIYKFQTALFENGDITFRYETLNFNGLFSPSVSGDNPVNVAPHHTAGISATNGSSYITVTDDTGDSSIAPLNNGTGRTVMSLFQSCHSWIFDTGFADATNLCSRTGLTTVGHYDSRIFDAKSSAPTWGNMYYQTSGAGLIDLYVRTSSSLNFPDWNNTTHLMASNIIAGTATLTPTIPSDRYLQYRAVFKKTNALDNPVLNNIKFDVGYVTIDEVSIPLSNSTNVSQGQSIDATMTFTNHFSSPIDVYVASLTFSWGSSPWVRTSPLPTSVPAGASATIDFQVNIATDSTWLNNWITLGGSIETGDGVATLSSSDAIVRSNRYAIRQKATLVIDKSDTSFEVVNKGQGGIPVDLHIRNTSDYVPLLFDAAFLTFTLGNYSWSPVISFLPSDHGLFGEYYQMTTGYAFIDPPMHSRIDPIIDFDWTNLSPFPDMGNDYIAIRWTGIIEPQFTELYTFYTRTDDGVRLWIDDQLVIDRWINQSAATERTGTINLSSGIKVKIVVEYYERTSNASAQLSWSSPSTIKAIVPSNRLFPTFCPTLQPNGTRKIPFTVAVLPDSESGLAFISGTASGTNVWVPGLITDTTSAIIPDSWIIESPASIAVGIISNPPYVYRGQANIPVDVQIVNLGEADALISSAPLFFTLGSYTAVIPGETMPVTVPGGDNATVKVLVSISENTPTGTVWIDADAIGSDANVGTPISASGAAQLGEWIILAEKILSYKDPSFLYPSSSFTRPEATNQSVYALAENLAPLREYAIRWYEPSGTEIVSSTTIGFSNASGTLSAEWEVTPVATYGVYTLKITNFFNTYSPAQTSFRVVTSASITADIDIPSSVSVGQTFATVMTLSNSGGGAATGVIPSSLTTSGTGNANLTSGPTPPSVEIEGGSIATITWQYNAAAPGTFSVSGNGSGFDANSLKPLSIDTAVSPICVIQIPASVVINAVVATPTIVYRDAHNITVELMLENLGEANAQINSAQLLFSPNFGGYTLASPTLPAIIPGFTVSTYTFDVSIRNNAPLGMATMTGRINFEDVNNPLPITITDKTDSWEIRAGILNTSRYSGFNNYQSSFNIDQTVYAKGWGLPADTPVRVRFYDSTEPYPPTGPGIGILTPLVTDPSGVVTHSHFIPNSTDQIGRWMTLVDDDVDGDPNTLGNILAVEFFDVVGPGTFSLELRFASESCFVGDIIDAEFTINNLATYPTDIRHYLYYFRFNYPPGSTGSVSYVNWNSSRGWHTDLDEALSSHTFKIQMLATSHSGAGACSINYYNNHWRYNELNTGQYVWDNKDYISNPIPIYEEHLDATPSTWDFGSIAPGDLSATLSVVLTSTSNHSLDNVYMSRSDLRKTATETLSSSYLAVSPSFPISMATGTPTTIANLDTSFLIPFHQSPGTYTASMQIYEDKNVSGGLEVVDTIAQIQVTLQVANSARAMVTADTVNLGVMGPGEVSSSKEIEFVGIGNKDLTDLKFLPISDITITPQDIGPFPYNGYGTSSIFITVPALATPGLYTATGTLYDDIIGGATDTFTIEWSVGTLSFQINPTEFNLGYGTPTVNLPTLSTTITNTGELPLSNLRAMSTEFVNVDQVFAVATDNIDLQSPAFIATGSSDTASADVYVPGGTATGTYIATFTWFEDSNQNGLLDVAEVSQIATATFHVRSFYRLYTLNATQDFGGVKPETSRSISTGYRNAGSLPMAKVRFEIASMTNGSDFFDMAHISVIPSASNDVIPGELRYVTLMADVPLIQTLGIFWGDMYIYADLNDDSVRDPSEPYFKTQTKIEIGNQEVSIISPSSIDLSGAAASQSTSIFMATKNTGTLALVNVMVETSVLTHTVSGTTIASSAFVFRPSSKVGIMVPTQTKSTSTMINIPMGASVGTFTGTIWVWEDGNKDGIRQAAEVAASAPIELIVDYVKALQTDPLSIDLGFVAKGDIATASFLAQNVGNTNLIDARWEKYSLFSGASTIPPSNISITPDPIGAMGVPLPSLPVNQPSTFTITIPTGSSDGAYSGNMVLYEDDINPAIDTYNTGLEPHFDFAVTLQVVTPFVGVSPDPINIPATDPTGWSATASIIVSNPSLIKFKNLKYTISDLANGIYTIPSANVSITPSAFSSLTPGASENASISVYVYPTTTVPGVYTGTINVWDDRNYDGSKNAWETDTPVLINITVNPYPLINIIPSIVDGGSIARNAFSSSINVPFQNTGNVELSGLFWTKSDLASGVESITNASITFSFIQPEPILPGDYATATVKIGRISPTQFLCEYGDNIQVLNTAAGCNDSLLLRCKIIPGGPQGLTKGTIWQEIATSTFPIPPDSENYILSAFVSPATGSAEIGFLTTDEVGNQTNYYSIQCDAVGNTALSTPLTTSGDIVTKVEQSHPVYGTLPWYRLYIRFPYSYDATTASKTYIILKNAKAFGSGHTALFDGVQLELSTNEQLKPTSFHEGYTIHSPSKQKSLSGENSYYQW